MRNIVLILATLVLTGTVFAQGPAPTPPSPDTRVGTLIYNQSPFTNRYFRLGAGADTNTLAITKFGSIKWLRPYDAAASGWRLGSPDYEWDRGYFDTLDLTSTSGRLHIDNDYFYRLDGDGLISSGGLNAELRAVLGTSISSPEIVDTTIQPADLSDTAVTWILAALHLGTSADSDAVMDRQYIDTRIAGIPTVLDVADTASYSDGYTLTWDKTSSKLNLQADDGAGSGDDIKYNVGGGDVDLSAAVFKGDINVDNDTITVNAGIRADADTVGGSSAIYDWSQSDLQDIDRLSADTVKPGLVVSFPTAGGYVDSCTGVNGVPNSYINLYAPGTAPSALNIFNDYGVIFNEGLTEKLRINGDSLIGKASGGNIARGFKWMSTDSITVGSVVLGGYVAGSLNPAMAARNVRDSLTSYLLKTNENWLDISSDASIRHYSGLNATDEMERITRTLNGDDTTTHTVLSGNYKIESPLSVSIIGGPGNPTLDDTLNLNGNDIIGIQRAYGDTADFTTYLNVPGLEGMTDSIAAVRTDLDSLNADVGTNYPTITAAKGYIGDSLAVRKWEHMTAVASWVKPLEDSVYLMDNVVMDRGSATPEQYIVLDSAGDIDVTGGSQLDTFFIVGNLPEACVLDSFRYTYKVSGAGVNITSIDLMGP